MYTAAESQMVAETGSPVVELIGPLKERRIAIRRCEHHERAIPGSQRGGTESTVAGHGPQNALGGARARQRFVRDATSSVVVGGQGGEQLGSVFQIDHRLGQ